VMKGLNLRWKITELGEISSILGMKVSRDRPATKICSPNRHTSTESLDRRLRHYRKVEERRRVGRGINPNTAHAVPRDHRVLAVGCRLHWTRYQVRHVPGSFGSAAYRDLWQMAPGMVSNLSSTRAVGLTSGGDDKKPGRRRSRKLSTLRSPKQGERPCGCESCSRRWDTVNQPRYYAATTKEQ
jgi:hypothetical protein